MKKGGFVFPKAGDRGGHLVSILPKAGDRGGHLVFILPKVGNRGGDLDLFIFNSTEAGSPVRRIRNK